MSPNIRPCRVSSRLPGAVSRRWFDRIAIFAVLIAAAAPAGAASLIVYDGALESGFADYYSWASTYSFANTTPVRNAETHSISFKPDNWGGVRILANNGNSRYAFADYGSLTLWVHGGSGSGQKINLDLALLNNATGQSADYGSVDLGANVSGGIVAGTWKQATISFDALGLTYGTFNELTFQANSSVSATQPQVYLTDIVFNTRSTPIASGAVVSVAVDTKSVGRAVNPLIFGVAYGDATRNGQVGYTLRRWGGNSTTRYNWQVDVHNTANDYYFENIPDTSDRTHVPPLNNTADKFITEAKTGGAQALITIPTIGWTPRADSALNHPYTVGFSVAKYGAQQSTDYYDPNAGNGNRSDGTPITGNDPHDSSTPSDPAFEKGWIAHLQSTFGNAANGGVRYYSLDNEVMLWDSTHRDVHPAPPDEDEIWNKAASYGAAIKQQDPNARVTGPVTWGYCDLFWSAKDNCGGSSADRNAAGHGGLAFVAWYLQQVCAHPTSTGQRVVDYLDLHYYPQGNSVALSNDDSPTTAGLRMRSLKELYLADWVSQSWIGTLGGSTADKLSTPNLIPRVRGWINSYCPNTKLAITEYNWGNDDTTSGAIAQAEALAIFAREGVDMATRWVAPQPHTIAENAFSIFTNYDGAGSKVAGNSVAATSSSVDQVGAYAFDIPGQRTMVLLVNKDVSFHDANLSLPSARNATWKRYAFSGASNLAQVGGNNTLNGASLTVSALPPMSATLVSIANAAAAYVPVVPARLLDTRTGFATVDDIGAGAGALGGGGSLNIAVLGRGGVPATGVSAVVLNVTITAPNTSGFVTAWPTGSTRPTASNLNFTSGQTVANLVIAKLGANGQVSLFNSAGSTQLIADVFGYFTDSAQFTPVVPARLLDTRAGAATIDGLFAAGGALASAASTDLTIAGRDGLPAPGSVGAAVLNVTAVTPTASGYATIWPAGAGRPGTSNLNFVAGDIVPNLVISQVGSNGKVSLFNSQGSTHYVADLAGWFPPASELTSVAPARLLDTRAGGTTIDGTFAGIGAVGTGASIDLTVLGRGGIPANGVGAVVLNLTATGTTAPGFVTAWPTGSARPNASNLNFVAGQTIPNLVIGKVGSGGKISLFNAAGTTDLVVDAVGWFPAVQ